MWFTVLFPILIAFVIIWAGIYNTGDGIMRIQEKKHNWWRMWIYSNISLRVYRTTIGNAEIQYRVFGLNWSSLYLQYTAQEQQAIHLMEIYRNGIERWIASDDRDQVLAIWHGMKPRRGSGDYPGP